MPIAIRKGTYQDTEAYIQLLQKVHGCMANRDWFYLDTPEEIRAMMKDDMMQLWVAMDRDKLAAAFTILIPGLSSVNYGYDLDFSEQELLRVVNMDTVAVLPEYRGQGLQYQLMQAAERELVEQGRNILLCTVHPENRFSLQNILRQGYSIQKELPKYGSVRYFLRKDL